LRAELWRLRGVLIVAALAVATLWLGASGRLALYIHPRYEAFTIVLAVLALVGCAAAVALAVARARTSAGRAMHVHHDRAGHDPAGHGDHAAHDHDAPPRSPAGRAVAIAVLAVCAVVAASAVLLPPAALSSSAALQRDIVSGAGAAGSAQGEAALAAAEGGSAELFAAFTVRDWATLLHQTSDPAFYAGKPVDVVGFVTAHPDEPDVFYVSRFVIACCAIDAVPYGVPVELPGWQDRLEPDGWVRVTGGFVPGGAGMVLEPAEVTAVDEPAEPYLY